MSQLTAALIGADVAQVVTIVAGLAGGNRLSLKLDERRRSTELDLEALSNLYELYGQFFVHLKRWNTLIATQRDEPSWSDQRRILLLDTHAAEGRVEALLVKMVAEQELSDADRDVLGSFRQAYQQIREAVRNDVPLEWRASGHPEYEAFKSLAAAISCIIARRWNPKADQRTSDTVGALLAVTDNRYESSWTRTGTALRHQATQMQRPRVS